MSQLSEACEALQKAVNGAEIEINFAGERSVQVYWRGVIQLDCTPAQAAKAIVLFKQLDALGAHDC